MKRRRVVVAMSGGVDSSVAALLLTQQGYEVVGMTMCFNLAEGRSRRPVCCSPEGIEDSRRVCGKLGIRHYVVNMQEKLKDVIIREFIQEYLEGRTPNPCVRCNEILKFGVLWDKAREIDADYLATGHYARITSFGAKFFLRKGKDRKKDQSYFLYRLKPPMLKSILFPLGNYTKDKVRMIARKFSLPVAEKLGSQEICFLAGLDYRPFLREHVSCLPPPGEIVDVEGRVVGRHEGICFYTIGQRQGLGIALGYPAYVIDIDPPHNRIVVGPSSQAYKRVFWVKDTNFFVSPLKNKIAACVKVRYNHQGAPAAISIKKDYVEVAFKKPQFAITPGQSAVFYKHDMVMGGGIIDKVWE